MADIYIKKEHTLSDADVRERVNTLLSELGKEFGVVGTWEGNVCNIKGTGIDSGSVTISKESVELEISLQMMAKMFKGTIEGKILSKIDKLLA